MKKNCLKRRANTLYKEFYYMNSNDASTQFSTDSNPLISYLLSHGVAPNKIDYVLNLKYPKRGNAWFVAERIDPQKRRRPAIVFETETGQRWRYTDDLSPKYGQIAGYTPCWYGLTRALVMSDSAIVIVNGAISSLSGQLVGIPACAWMAGEGSNPDLSQLPKDRRIIVAYDCDKPGRDGSVKLVQTLRAAGYEACAVDLALDLDGGDVADFVVKHGDYSYEYLTQCNLLDIPVLVVRTAKPKPQTAIDYSKTNYSKLTLVQQAKLALDSLNSKRIDDQNDCVNVWYAIQGTLDFDDWDTWASKGWMQDKDIAWRKGHENQKSRELNIESLFKWAHEDKPGWNRLGLDIKDAKNSTQNVTHETIADLPFREYPYRFTDALRRILIAMTHPTAAPLFELIFRLPDPSVPFTLQSLYEFGIEQKLNVTMTTLKSSVKALAKSRLSGQFLDLTTLVVLISSKNTESYTSVERSRNSAGRHSQVYQLKPMEDIIKAASSKAATLVILKTFERYNKYNRTKDEAKLVAPFREEFLDELDIENPKETAKRLTELFRDKLNKQPDYKEVSNRAYNALQRLKKELTAGELTPLAKGWQIPNAPMYISVFAASVIIQAGGSTQETQTWWADKLGCEPTSLQGAKGIFARVGIRVEKDQTQDFELTGDITNAQNVISQVEVLHPKKWDYLRKGRPVLLISDKAGVPKPIADKGWRDWIKEQVGMGAIITVRYQRPNKQILDSFEPVTEAIRPTKRIAEPEPVSIAESAGEQPVIEAQPTLPIELPEPIAPMEKIKKPKPTGVEGWEVKAAALLAGVVVSAGSVVNADGEIVATYEKGVPLKVMLECAEREELRIDIMLDEPMSNLEREANESLYDPNDQPGEPDDDWDKQMKLDAASGKLDGIIQSATADYQSGLTHPLEELRDGIDDQVIKFDEMVGYPELPDTLTTTVCDVRSEVWDNAMLRTYCGRKNFAHGFGADSYWANPYKIGVDGNREEVIQQYRVHLFSNPSMLKRIPELRGHVLGCWCGGEDACHCDTLVYLANLPDDQLQAIIDDPIVAELVCSYGGVISEVIQTDEGTSISFDTRLRKG